MNINKVISGTEQREEAIKQGSLLPDTMRKCSAEDGWFGYVKRISIKGKHSRALNSWCHILKKLSKTGPGVTCNTCCCMLSGVLLLTMFCPLAFCYSYQQHQVFFQNTDYELNVYRIYGEQPGKTLLIIGGIQGDEPGGYLAADLYVEMSLKKGNLIVVPRANFNSILCNSRGINGDMNRMFSSVDLENIDGMIIEKLKMLIKQSDFLLNLHDGSGFYCEKWWSDLENPNRYGQSIIADCETFFSKKYNRTFNLGDMARSVCKKMNAEIKNSKHHFHFNNHRTMSKDTTHAEQRKSATYFALTQHEIPAFGIETSKNLPSPAYNVRYQTMAINSFMEEFGIIPEHPGIALQDPEMKYAIIAVNNNTPIVVYNGKTLFINRGDKINIIHAEVNYKRGITADIKAVGSFNDMRKELAVFKNTQILVKKDSLVCGRIPVVVNSVGACKNLPEQSKISYLIIQVNESKAALSPNEHLKVKRGDILIIRDIVAVDGRNSDFKVNFKGFVPDRLNNDGEDRGYRINTASDLILRYSLKQKGDIYRIVVTIDNTLIAVFFIDII
jgi:hypothetical protein